MGCLPSHSADKGVAVSKPPKRASRDAVKSVTVDKPEAEEDDALSRFVAGYVGDYPQKGSVTVYEDYQGYSTSTTNHMSKGKVDKICRWTDAALVDRHVLSNDVFFNPQNPLAWPKEVIGEHLSSPSFADRRSVLQNTQK